MNFFLRSAPYAPTFLRLFLGTAAIWHSFPVLFFGGLEDFTGFVSSLGIPLPAILAPLGKCFEFFGGLMVLTGFYSRIGALMIGSTLLVAVGVAHGFKIFSDAAMAADLVIMSIVIMLGGPGKFTIKEWPTRVDQAVL